MAARREKATEENPLADIPIEEAGASPAQILGEAPTDPTQPHIVMRDGVKYYRKRGREREIIGRFRQSDGSVWLKLKQPHYKDSRPGAAKPPTDFLTVAVPDPTYQQPKRGSAAIELDV